MQLSRTPAPTLPAAPLRSPTPGGGDLGHPGRLKDWRRGYPPGFPRARRVARSFRDLHLGRRPPGQSHPACLRAPAPPARACPCVSLCTSSLPGPRRHLTYPAAQGPGLGQGAWITSGWDAPLRPAGPALSGDLSCSQTLGASGSSRSSPPTPPPPSLLSLGSFFRVNYVSH